MTLGDRVAAGLDGNGGFLATSLWPRRRLDGLLLMRSSLNAFMAASYQ